MKSSYFLKIQNESQQFKKVNVFSSVRVTPELASDLLTLNTGNRPIKNEVLKKYIESMKKEQWKFNGDSIRISRTGKLLDGQHRLLAISQSGIEQYFNVQTGLDDDSFEVMDTGKNRSAGDVLAILGFKNHTVMAGAIRLVIQYDSMHSSKQRYWPDRRTVIGNSQIAKWTETHNTELMVNCVYHGSKMYGKSRILLHTVYAAFYYIFSRKDREDADLFFSILSSGEGCTSSVYSPVYLLRQKLINMLNSRHSLKDVSEKYALIIKAWNLFRDRKEIKQLSIQTDKEEFPKAI